MFSRLAGNILHRRLRNSPSVNETVDEAASQYLGKAAKLETAVDAVLTHDFRELAQAERDRVDAYAASRVPGLSGGRKPKPGADEMGNDFIICDDYRKGTGTVATAVMGAVTVAALAFGGFGLWMATQKPEIPPPADFVDTTSQVFVE